MRLAGRPRRQLRPLLSDDERRPQPRDLPPGPSGADPGVRRDRGPGLAARRDLPFAHALAGLSLADGPGAGLLPRGVLRPRLAGRPGQPGDPRVHHPGRRGRGAGGSDLMSGFGGFTEEQVLRYSRHIILPKIGSTGQRKLLEAKVLCVGAGGLGSPVAMYLAAAGVGTLGIVDFDKVDLTNLQRQLLHDTDDVGRPKVDSAAERLAGINPHAEGVR